MLEFAMNKPPNWRGLLLVALVAGWLMGIMLSNWLDLSQPICLASGLVSLVACYFYWRKPWIRSIALVLLCLNLGAWRYAAISPVHDPQAISAFIGTHPVELQGTIATEPDLKSNSTLLTVSTQSISLDNGQTWQNTHGEIQVQLPGATFDNPYGPHYGDSVALTGKLLAPPTYSTPELLASMNFPGMEIDDQEGNPLLVWLYQWRTQLAGTLLQTLPQPFSALIIALFLSLRLPALRPLIPLFNVTGVAHLIAPSGFKVTLLAGLATNSTHWLVPDQPAQGSLQLSARRLPKIWKRRLRVALVILFITLYTFLSGGGPAAIRAGIMGTLLVIAPRLDRLYNVYTALAFTALLMSLVNPYVLWDSGFQLSFIGTLGIVLMTPFFQRLCGFLKRLPLGTHILEIVAVTLAAQTATLPLFLLYFNQISFVAPLTNIICVPLLGPLLALSALICLGALVSIQLALILSWLAWPLLWFVTTTIAWCASLPGAYLLIDHLNLLLAWGYYALLLGFVALLLTRWKRPSGSEKPHSRPLLSTRTRHIALGCLACLTILATGIAAWTTQSTGQLTITFLSTGNPSQGQALLIHTPDGQTALIDEEADSTILDQTLDARLPFWQRSLNMILLPDNNANNLSGLQDIITRYQVAQIVDAGMLHPSAAYALWRSTLSDRNLSYSQVRQGSIIALGSQITLQVLWPEGELHKSSNEEQDNALVLRVLAPGFSMLLLNTASLSSYALQGLITDIPHTYLQNAIVQITGKNGADFPAVLTDLLRLAHPTFLLVMPVPARKSKSARAGVAPSGTPAGPWKILYTAQVNNLEIRSTSQGWHFST